MTVEDLDRDPYRIYARLRNEAPACLVPAVGLWLVSRWADVEEAATRPEVFAARVDPLPLERTMGGESILLLDGTPASGSVREGSADEPLPMYPTRVVDGRVEVEV